MAFVTKYTLNWMDVDGNDWDIAFQEDGWDGAVTALTPGASPCKMTWNGGDKFQPIVGSNLDIQMVHESAIDDLYTEEAQSIKVILTRESVVKWTGFISQGQYFRQFNQPVHYVTVTAADGLGELKNIKFEDDSGDPYYGQEEEAVVIANILLKTGISKLIVDRINIFDANHTTGAAYSPLNQTYLYQEAYWDEQTDERSNCYEVLEAILIKYGATIRTTGSAWHLLRPNSFSQSLTPYRIFTSAGVYDSNDAGDQSIDFDADLFYIYADQELSRIMGVGISEVIQNPPRRQNMFKNGSFDAFTWTGGAADYWTATGSPSYSESADRLKMRSNVAVAGAIPTKYIETSVNIYYPNSININFEWTPVFTGTPTYKNLYLQIYDGTYYLTTAGWQSGVGYYIIGASLLSPGIMKKLSIPIPEQFAYGYDGVFTLRFRIYEFHNENIAASNFFYLDNLRLDVGMDLPETKLHSYTNPVAINQIQSKEIALGDSWRTGLIDDAYFINTYNAGTNFTTLWSITGDPTAAAPLCEVLARQNAEAFRRGIDVLSGTLRSTYTPFGTLGIRDANLVDEYGFVKTFFPTNVTLDTRLSEVNGTWIECPATYTDSELEWASHTCGGDATINGNEIEVNECDVAGPTNFATFDSYTAVEGELVRVVLNLIDDGSSYRPIFYYAEGSQTTNWGLNYYTFYNTAGAKTLFLRNISGSTQTFNFTCTLGIYKITGI